MRASEFIREKEVPSVAKKKISQLSKLSITCGRKTGGGGGGGGGGVGGGGGCL